MEPGLRQHFAGAVLFLLIANCQMTPLPPHKFGGKIQDGDQAVAKSAPERPALPNMAKLQPVAAAATPDQAPAASDHGHLARVQIKVYRGPDDHHHHAPYGYWVKQPADDAPHHH